MAACSLPQNGLPPPLPFFSKLHAGGGGHMAQAQSNLVPHFSGYTDKLG